MRVLARHVWVIAALALPGGLAACGTAQPSKPAPGSRQNPLVAHTPQPTPTGTVGPNAPAPMNNEAPASGRSGSGKSTAPGYQTLLERQTKQPGSTFSPCNLVTAAQARSILGAPIQPPLEAPQGPTCIYRTKNHKRFITVAVQSVKFTKLKQQLHARERFAIAGQTGYCARSGQEMLYVPLSGARVLSVAAPCALGKLFARKALPRLEH